MKTIQKTLLITLVPLLTPLTAIAQAEKPSERGNTVHERKGSAASWRASHVIGLDVKNAESETIGEVEDLILDMKSGEIVAVVISTGGFLGLGETHSAVPVAVLRYDDRAEGFKTRLTKEQLGKAPQFKASEWPDYSEATSSEALRAYRESIGDNSNEQDEATQYTSNTARGNENTSRDRDNTTQNDKKTGDEFAKPTDQGNSGNDMKMTKDIRSGIMDSDMSSNAKNVKIVTRNERVTLNGVVDSDAEHKEILKIAGKHCSESRIIDNLQVKNK